MEKGKQAMSEAASDTTIYHTRLSVTCVFEAYNITKHRSMTDQPTRTMDYDSNLSYRIWVRNLCTRCDVILGSDTSIHGVGVHMLLAPHRKQKLRTVVHFPESGMAGAPR